MIKPDPYPVPYVTNGCAITTITTIATRSTDRTNQFFIWNTINLQQLPHAHERS